MTIGVDTAETGPAAHDPAADESIQIRGARVHNLQNVDIDLPRDRMIVMTGPSGSGKSSLAFDTLFAEGQRQYIESLSVYARQFLHQLERPDVDLIEGLQPTVSIDQRAGSQNPRSTVATVTEIYDYLRLLYARLGDPACPKCGETIRQQTSEQIIADLRALPTGTKLVVMAPMVRGRKGSHKDVLAAVRKAGFVRVRVDGEVFDVDQVGELAPRKNHTIEAVVDRIVVRDGVDARLAESTRLALTHGEGAVVALYLEPGVDGLGEKGRDAWHEQLYSTLYACPHCKISFEEIEPRTFSFNSPYGACPTCEGLGCRVQFDPELVVPDDSLSLAEGAVAAWRGGTPAELRRHKTALSDFDWNLPIAKFPPKLRERLFAGDGNGYVGLLNLLEQELATTMQAARRDKLEALRGVVVCKDCGGARLRAEARACRFNGRAIHELTALSVSQARTWLSAVRVDAGDEPIWTPIWQEIDKRLDFLEKVGVDYLTLDRPSDTLSGGELQRVRLATGIGSGLVGVCYVLDEPSIGLHQRDNERLIDALRRLQQQGNTVLVVEHDEAIMRSADWLVDIGPGAGRNGGRVVAQGTPEEVAANPDSVTGRYLSGQLTLAVPPVRRRAAKTRSITVEGATGNNLKDVDARFPLRRVDLRQRRERFGQEHAGQRDLGPGARPALGGQRTEAGGASQPARRQPDRQAGAGGPVADRPHAAEQPGHLYRRVRRDPPRLCRHSRGAAARLQVRTLQLQRQRGPLRRVPGSGHSPHRDELPARPYGPLPRLRGHRFNAQTLEVRYRGLSVADVLDLSVDEALAFFENFPLITRLLGQPARGRPGLRDPGAVVHHALGRRSAAHQAGHRASPGRHGQHFVRSGRADHGTALRRHSQAAGRAQPPG